MGLPRTAYEKGSDTLFKVANMILNSATETQLNTANAWVFLHWRQPDGKTLSQMRFGNGNISGTPTSALSWEIFASDVQGAIGASTGVSGTATPAAYTTTNPTGLSLALTAGNYYGVLIKNAHATPASNFFNLLQPIATAGQLGWGMRVSQDGGTTYDDSFGGVPPLQLGFSDSTRLGVVAMRSQPSNTGNNLVYATGGSRLGYHGIQFRPPGRHWLHRAEFSLRLTGTLGSAGSLTCKVFRSTTEIASVSVTSPSISTSGNRQCVANFTSPVLVEPDSDYSVVLANSGGTASHYWAILGSAQTIILPTSVDECVPWGLHAVQALGANLSLGWTRPTEQYYAQLAFSPALRA